MTSLLYHGRLYDDLVIPLYMTILLYRGISNSAVYIYLYAVQLAFSAPLASQGALHHQLAGHVSSVSVSANIPLQMPNSFNYGQYHQKAYLILKIMM